MIAVLWYVWKELGKKEVFQGQPVQSVKNIL
jgi:hypothetical protein